MSDALQLRVRDLEIDVLTGIYSEETRQPQPLRVSVTADLDPGERFLPTTELARSKSYLDLKGAVTERLPRDVHFKLIEAVADHIVRDIFDGDARVRRVEVVIDKLAIAGPGETIGIRLVRSR